MLNVNDQTKQAYLSDGVHKSLRIVFPELNLTLTNEHIVAESFKLKQGIQSNGDIDFCGGIASTCSFGIEGNIYELAGHKVQIYMTAGDTEEIPLFTGIVDSSERKGINETTKTITAYDYMKVINEADVTSWYKALSFPITIKNLRNSFFDLFGYSQKSINLVNDNFTVTNNAEDGTVSGKDIINAICQTNGCFGQFGNDGVFKYIYLDVITEGLYPDDDLYPASDLYPAGENTNAVVLQNDKIVDCKYEDYRIEKIDRVVLMTKDGTIGASAGSGNNTWQIMSNILTQGFTSAQYQSVVNNLLSKVSLLWYCVADVKAMGNPLYECGDVMLFRIKSDIMRTYILHRSLSGIQNLQDEYVADGDVERSTQFNSIQAQIDKLSQKTSVNTKDISTNKTNISTNTTNIGNLRADLITTNNLVAQKASISDLNATNARVGNLEADHVSVGDLNAVSARVGSLEADHVSVQELNAVNGKFNNLNANNITAGTLSFNRLSSDGGAVATWVHYTVVYEIDWANQDSRRITLHYLGHT